MPEQTKLTDPAADIVSAELRKAIDLLEECGRAVCPVSEGVVMWNAINSALEQIHNAIHQEHLLRDSDGTAAHKVDFFGNEVKE